MSKYLTPAALLEDDTDLVSLPDIVIRLQEAVRDPRSTADTFADIIRNDPALTAPPPPPGCCAWPTAPSTATAVGSTPSPGR